MLLTKTCLQKTLSTLLIIVIIKINMLTITAASTQESQRETNMEKLTTCLALTATTLSLAVAANPFATQNEGGTQLETVTIIGSKEQAATIPGSGAVIDQEQIRIEAATDINQLLKSIKKLVTFPWSIVFQVE